MTNETTQLLKNDSGKDCGDECCDTYGTNKTRNRNLARLKDVFFGALLAGFVAILIANHTRAPTGRPSHHEAAQPDWSVDDDIQEDQTQEQSNLRSGKSSSSDETTKDAPINNYTKFQAFGFQIYTGGKLRLSLHLLKTTLDRFGLLTLFINWIFCSFYLGAPALMPVPGSEEHKHPKLMNNPECEGASTHTRPL